MKRITNMTAINTTSSEQDSTGITRAIRHTASQQTTVETKHEKKQ